MRPLHGPRRCASVRGRGRVVLDALIHSMVPVLLLPEVTLMHDEELPTAAFSLRGELDMARAPQCHYELEAYAAFTRGDVVCDCAELDFLDSSGIAMFVDVSDELAVQGRAFRLVNLNGLPLRALQICGLLGRFGLITERVR